MKTRLILVLIAAFFAAVPARAQTGAGAFWRSLLIPGWGQQYAGHAGGRFMAAELTFWAGYVAFDRLGQVRADKFRTYAAERAGAKPAGKNDTYLDDLGFYESRQLHNEFALYEEGPNAQIYPRGTDFYWEWDKSESRERYRELRNSSENAKRQALYMTGFVVANHLIAAVHAARNASQQSSTGRNGDGIQAILWPAHRGIQLSLLRRF